MFRTFETQLGLPPHRTKQAGEPDQRQERRDVGIPWAILVIGLIPLVGYAVRGAWSQVELAIASLMVLFAVVELFRQYFPRPPGERGRARNTR